MSSQQQNYDNDNFIAEQIDKSHNQDQDKNQQQYLDGFDNSNNYYDNPVCQYKQVDHLQQINCSLNNDVDHQYQQHQNCLVDNQGQYDFLLDHPQIQQVPYDYFQQHQPYQQIQYKDHSLQNQKQQIYSVNKENVDHCKIKLKYDKSADIQKCLINDYQYQNKYDDSSSHNSSQVPFVSEEQEQNESYQQIDFQESDNHKKISQDQFSQIKAEQLDISQEDSSSSSFQSKSLINYKKGPYKKYDESQKAEAISRVQSGQDMKFVSQQMKIPKKNIKRWLIVGPKRQSGGGRKVLDPEMERKLYKWYLTISKTQTISKSQLRQQAKKFLTVDSKQFKASKGWLDKFIKRKNLNLPNNYQENTQQNISKKQKK